ncbi:hypothetical protein PV08_05417 [Exophiala spinifera]|uniref:Uncharacterized protein n=1 Tax=Exophiala spinifera TaxID=91928 RepID=A0A0D1YK61_9EURO|nr:uncharacterized protein PV08_05417 [Exophiala spinifera]KIW15371.1 hypothetical protein PV08_05417 [Exophiala spinifera]
MAQGKPNGVLECGPGRDGLVSHTTTFAIDDTASASAHASSGSGGGGGGGGGGVVGGINKQSVGESNLRPISDAAISDKTTKIRTDQDVHERDEDEDDDDDDDDNDSMPYCENWDAFVVFYTWTQMLTSIYHFQHWVVIGMLTIVVLLCCGSFDLGTPS